MIGTLARLARVAGLACIALFVVALATAGLGGRIAFDVLWSLLFGWSSYVPRVLSRVQLSWSGLRTAMFCLTLVTAGLHGFLRWLVREMKGASAGWKARWTLTIVAVVVLMFASGTAAVGMFHQAGWLLTSKKPLVYMRANWSSYSGGSQPMNDLKYVGLGVHNRASMQDDDPRDGPPSKLSWQAEILPYVWAYVPTGVDPRWDWNSPENSAGFRSVVIPYLSPYVRALRNEDGFALSHIAGNVNVFGVGFPNSADLKAHGDGVMLAGEVASGFRPWGDPGNLRDPSLPFDGSPRAFGSPRGGGATVLMNDGSVRFVSDRADPAVLRALAGRPRR